MGPGARPFPPPFDAIDAPPSSYPKLIVLSLDGLVNPLASGGCAPIPLQFSIILAT